MAKGKILLVEDDRALVELLVYHFERGEFEVRATADGEEALLLAREAPPDVVILDWMLEGLSGIEVCRRLRRTMRFSYSFSLGRRGGWRRQTSAGAGARRSMGVKRLAPAFSPFPQARASESSA